MFLLLVIWVVPSNPNQVLWFSVTLLFFSNQYKATRVNLQSLLRIYLDTNNQDKSSFGTLLQVTQRPSLA